MDKQDYCPMRNFDWGGFKKNNHNPDDVLNHNSPGIHLLSYLIMKLSNL